MYTTVYSVHTCGSNCWYTATIFRKKSECRLKEIGIVERLTGYIEGDEKLLVGVMGRWKDGDSLIM